MDGLEAFCWAVPQNGGRGEPEGVKKVKMVAATTESKRCPSLMLPPQEPLGSKSSNSVKGGQLKCTHCSEGKTDPVAITVFKSKE